MCRNPQNLEIFPVALMIGGLAARADPQANCRSRFLNFLRFLSMLLLVVCNSTLVAAGDEHPRLFAEKHEVGAKGKNSERIAEIAQNIIIYVVENGQKKTIVLPPAELTKINGIATAGYVCGVVIVSDKELSISIGGREFSRSRGPIETVDSIESIDGFHHASAVLPPSSTSVVYSTPAVQSPVLEDWRNNYTLFPAVFGDALEAESLFEISIGVGGETLTLPVRQDGIRDFHVEPTPEGNHIPFRYLGTRLEVLRHTANDFKDRIRTITRGVAGIEAAFQLRLIERINIVDLENIRNAVTTTDGREIWFYIDAFLNEPIQELETIAAHETLHKLISKLGFSLDPEIRKLYADLKGYELFSNERFMLVMTGKLSPDIPSGVVKNNGKSIFFDFIDERNFLSGMKGGHSTENMEEFCTSLIHSIIHISRLKENLETPINIGHASISPRFLTMAEKDSILRSYSSAIECLLGMLPKYLDNNSPEYESAKGIFERASENVHCRTAELRPGRYQDL